MNDETLTAAICSFTARRNPFRRQREATIVSDSTSRAFGRAATNPGTHTCFSTGLMTNYPFEYLISRITAGKAADSQKGKVRLTGELDDTWCRRENPPLPLSRFLLRTRQRQLKTSELAIVDLCLVRTYDLLTGRTAHVPSSPLKISLIARCLSRLHLLSTGQTTARQ